MLALINVYKKYNNKVILNDISLSIDSGIYILKGINGSGKSTLLKIISKIIYKSSGEITSNEIISYLPDKYSLPRLVKSKKYLNELIKLCGSQYKSNDLLFKWKLPNKSIGNLSKGNYQKIGLIQALLLNASIYVFDEPLDGLDDFARIQFKESILALKESGKKIIISLHNDDLFNDVEHKLYLIKDGNLYEEN